jgi:hypothetical protein
MRALTTLVLLFAPLATACTDDTVGENTAYRRLLDAYNSEADCLSSTVNACYQTLTLCTNGNATVDLSMRPMRGTYLLQGSIARTETIDMSFDFDLETLSSPDLPGRNRWAQVESLTYDCSGR